MYKINGASLDGYSAFYSYAVDGFNDNGSYIYETLGTGAGMGDLGNMYVEFGVLDNIQISSVADLIMFDPQSEIWVSKNILAWAVDSTDAAGVFGFDQRFSQAVIPEPSTFLLLGGGLAGLAFYRRRRRKE